MNKVPWQEYHRKIMLDAIGDYPLITFNRKEMDLPATGRALSVVMQGVNNKVALRKEWWIKALKGLNKSILFFIERYVPDANLLIGGNYRTDVFISSVLLRSVSDEINKLVAEERERVREFADKTRNPYSADANNLMRHIYQNEGYDKALDDFLTYLSR